MLVQVGGGQESAMQHVVLVSLKAVGEFRSAASELKGAIQPFAFLFDNMYIISI